MPPRRGVLRPRRSVLALSALVVATAGPLPTPATAAPVRAPHALLGASAGALRADAGLESQFVSRINGLRSSKGLGALAVSGELVGVARSWTDHMLQAGQISHNPNLGSSVSGSWSKLGENVGVGYDVDGLMRAFINSSAHYSNLVDPDWTHVGVGVSIAADGRIYTTHNFMALGTPAPPPTTPPPPSPPPTAPPTPTAAAPVARTSPTPAPAPAPAPPEPAAPRPTPERVTAVLDPLRSLEGS